MFGEIDTFAKTTLNCDNFFFCSQKYGGIKINPPMYSIKLLYNIVNRNMILTLKFSKNNPQVMYIHKLHCSVQWLETRSESDFKTMQRTKQFFKAPHNISTTNVTRWPKNV